MVRHYQEHGKTEYVSVTSITGLLNKPALYYWYGKHGNAYCKKVFKEAGILGTYLHEYINYYYNDKLKELKLRVPVNNQPVRNFLAFNKLRKPKAVIQEITVFSKIHGYAGTFDGIFIIDGKLVILDWKTSSFIGDDYLMQLAAYYFAYLETFEHEIKEGDMKVPEGFMIVKFSKKRAFDEKEDIKEYSLEEIEAGFQGFLGLLQTYKSLNKIKEIIKCKKN